jgi:hypothetical protein
MQQSAFYGIYDSLLGDVSHWQLQLQLNSSIVVKVSPDPHRDILS